jgi:phosphoglycerate transporter family protein
MPAPTPSSTRSPASAEAARSAEGPLGFLWRAFRPTPAAAVILQDPARIKAQYQYWQRRVLVATIIGYATFYLVRKNLSVAMPALGKDLHIGKAELGLFLTLHGLLYGFSKFANGVLADRANARVFMAAGLILSAGCNLWFGFSSTVLVLGLVWMLNGWVQGMGFPPCARLLGHWFSPKEMATKYSIWNTSHSLGAGLVVVLCGYLVAYHWRLCFFVPAALALGCTLFLFRSLPDTPPSVGLPEVAGTEQAPEAEAVAFSSALLQQVFANKYIWFLSLGSFCVYTVRYAVLDWGPTFLSETRHIQLAHTGWMVAAFEIAGVAGMLLSGWMTDRLFGGRACRVCVISTALTGVSMLLFWKLPTSSPALSTLLLCSAGFFLYGPQALVGVVVVNLATKRLAATAIGFTSIFSYASTLLSGWGLGKLVEQRGWNAGFGGMMLISVLGTLLFALCWRARVHGYANTEQPELAAHSACSKAGP